MNFFSFFHKKDLGVYTYKYEKREDIYYPIVPINFYTNSTPLFGAKALVDTGADLTLIPKTLGLDIGLKRTQLQYIGGVGGRMGYYLNNINVGIADKKVIIPVAWSTQDTVPLLLGRKGVFDKFKFCFNDKSKEIVVLEL